MNKYAIFFVVFVCNIQKETDMKQIYYIKKRILGMIYVCYMYMFKIYHMLISNQLNWTRCIYTTYGVEFDQPKYFEFLIRNIQLLYSTFFSISLSTKIDSVDEVILFQKKKTFIFLYLNCQDEFNWNSITLTSKRSFIILFFCLEIWENGWLFGKWSLLSLQWNMLFF